MRSHVMKSLIMRSLIMKSLITGNSIMSSLIIRTIMKSSNGHKYRKRYIYIIVNTKMSIKTPDENWIVRFK